MSLLLVCLALISGKPAPIVLAGENYPPKKEHPLHPKEKKAPTPQPWSPSSPKK